MSRRALPLQSLHRSGAPWLVDEVGGPCPPFRTGRAPWWFWACVLAWRVCVVFLLGVPLVLWCALGGWWPQGSPGRAAAWRADGAPRPAPRFIPRTHKNKVHRG